MAERLPPYSQQRNNGRPPPERGGFRLSAIVTRPPDRDRILTPTIPREYPPPPSRRKPTQPLAKALEEAMFEPTRTADQREKNRKLRVLISRGILASLVLGGGVIWGLNRVFGDSEPAPQTSSADFPNSFNDNRLVLRAAETKTINPKEVFDKNADEQTAKVGVNARPISQEEALALAKKILRNCTKVTFQLFR